MSSLPDEDSIPALIDASLTTLRRECPHAYHLLCTLLAPREVAVQIEGETAALNFDVGAIRVTRQPRDPGVWFRTTRQTILDLLDAQLTLVEAVLSGMLVLQGDTDDLALFHEGFLTYLRGGVRCPSFPALLDRFRHPPGQRAAHVPPGAL